MNEQHRLELIIIDTLQNEDVVYRTSFHNLDEVLLDRVRLVIIHWIVFRIINFLLNHWLGDKCLERRGLRSFTHEIVSDLLRSAMHTRDLRGHVCYECVDVNIFGRRYVFFILITLVVIIEFCRYSQLLKSFSVVIECSI